MKWSPQQEQALKDVAKWLEVGDKPIYRLFGSAGTGKTTLAMHLAESCRNPMFAAFTGKAALVLQEKGCPKASTLHKLIYKPAHKSKARLEKLEQQLEILLAAEDASPQAVKMAQDAVAAEEENMSRMMFHINYDSDLQDADLLVVDECSMVDAQMAEDILQFGVPVLVLGDPYQLPPVGGEGYFTASKPDTMLTEIHRQAAESPIIQLATWARQGQSLIPGVYGNCEVHCTGTPMKEIGMAADQILVGKNKTRDAVNHKMRKYLERTSALPQPGDRLVCTKNNHKEGLLNGQIWICAGESEPGDDRTYLLTAYPEDDEGAVRKIEVWCDEFKWFEAKEHEHFEFAYALTCHKAQGSQWDHVLIMDESRVFRKDKSKWLYTAVTRAAEKLDIVKML